MAKKVPLVLIEWDDPQSFHDETLAKAGELFHWTTIGWLVEETDTLVKVSNTIGDGEGHGMIIAKSLITKRRKIPGYEYE